MTDTDSVPPQSPHTTQTSQRVLVTVCTYNEKENLPLLLPEIWASAPAVDVLVVDDNSPDGTGTWAVEATQHEPRLKVLQRPGKQGLGTATLAGFQYALDHNYDWVVNLDADFSHHPRHLPAILDLLPDHDVVIGSRYVAGGKIVGWNWYRYVMSWGINTYARWLLGLRTRDNSGAYRAYRVAMLRKLDFQRFRARGYAFQEEVLYRCRRVGCRFVETPITFEDRRFGQSKINWKETVTALWVIARLRFER